MTRRFNIKFAALALAVALSTFGAIPATDHTYSNGFSTTVKIAEGLYEALPPKFSDKVSARPITLQAQEVPVIAPVVLTDESKSDAEVCISAGFIDLMNHVAHAKAIDKIQPGFFAAYVQNLAHNSSGHLVLPDMVDARFWTDDVMDDQTSCYNQMMSALMAINLSHHYLGHYTKYAAQLANPENKAVPINQLLNQDEWNVSVKCGVHNALDCAMATDGLRALFEAIDRLPQRPPWAIYVVPQYADLKKLSKQLHGWEDDFFHGRMKDL